MFVLFLALAAGALMYVIQEIFSLGRRLNTPLALGWGVPVCLDDKICKPGRGEIPDRTSGLLEPPPAQVVSGGQRPSPQELEHRRAW